MIIEDDYIFLIPEYEFAPEHKHSMLHIFISIEKISIKTDRADFTGNFCVLNSNISHQVNTERSKSFIFLIDPGSDIADLTRDRYLKSDDIYIVDLGISYLDHFRQILEDFGDYNKGEEILKILELLNSDKKLLNKDDRIYKVVEMVRSGEYLQLEIPEIAEKVYLSESRLSHLFKEEMGMNLKNYIMMNKMKKAFMYLKQGNNVTEAALKANFYDSAHLCNLVKKTTGLNISEITRKRPLI
ncbi:MAG: helix-turn-helix transcriptional regulator [Tissierellia bacterium]|nr:helix-turn-helix transcriptional regulator [Tissierellia bacterium]